ncbi:MAG: cobyrinic acid a,c-diamide synthase [Spirochaetaceae bacterium]|nr:MAG: cobyrinic acid a,c-diamide synthase [Spirochaetaceae bacterium]
MSDIQGNNAGKGIFIASTGQHIGKTTTSLGIFSGLMKRTGTIGFIKPVGQEFVDLGASVRVDKDVLLFQKRFGLKDQLEHMSPVIFPRGFTRDYVDEKVDLTSIEHLITDAYTKLTENSGIVLAEGTGHVGVGSIADIDNARVAQLLGLPMILIASGGLGSAFDSLALNKHACDRCGVRIAGVVLNRVRDDKREMIIDYMTRALSRWGVPLLGAIPYSKTLAALRIDDYARLFDVPILAGQSHRYRHFDLIRLVATSNEVYEQLIEPRQLTITPASREDIINSTLLKLDEWKRSGEHLELKPGIILTGRYEPDPSIVNRLIDADVPVLYTPLNSFDVMKKITEHTAKIHIEDTKKVNTAVDLVESHIDIDQLLTIVSSQK